MLCKSFYFPLEIVSIYSQYLEVTMYDTIA